MKPSCGLGKAAELSKSVHRQLDLYALAASAAGVWMLALAQPVEAKIIYKPPQENIGPKTFLDVNDDGNLDSKFIASRTSRGVASARLPGAVIRFTDNSKGDSEIKLP